MKYYRYDAQDKKGRRFSSTVRAMDEDGARRLVEDRGMTILYVEEDPEAASRSSRHSVEDPLSASAAKRPWNEVLSYAMPVGAAVLALLGIPLVMMLTNPQAPEESPRAVIERYWEYEERGDYEKQYALLSPERQKEQGNAQEYLQKRKRERFAGGTVKTKLTGIEALQEAPRKAKYKVKLLRSTGLAEAEMGLRPVRGQWRVETLRDPAAVARYMERLAGISDENQRRRMLVAVKSETGYSDLEIDALLEDFQKEQRKKEIGGDYLFAL